MHTTNQTSSDFMASHKENLQSIGRKLTELMQELGHQEVVSLVVLVAIILAAVCAVLLLCCLLRALCPRL